MLVDVAHASSATVDDVLAMAQRPVIASHTGLRGVVDSVRNLTDEQARGIAETGGLLGIGFALLILPTSLGVTGALMLVNGALWVPALARVIDTSLRYTVDKTTREILFLPLPNELKQQAKPFIDVTVDRFAKGIGALLVLVLIKPWGLHLTWQQLSWASLIMTGLWMAAAVRAPGLVATLLAAMPQEHERGLGGWPAEWDTLPELVVLSAGAARAMADSLEGLVVDPDRMRANLDLTHGLVMAEAIAMALAVPMGKEPAHRAVEAAAQRAQASGRPLADLLAEDPAVTRHLSVADIAARLAPASYLGAAEEFVRQALARHRSRGAKRA